MNEEDIPQVDPEESLQDIMRTVERMRRAADRATGMTPEMMAGLGAAGAAYGGRQQGKTHRAGEHILMGIDAANRRGEHTGFSFRNERGELLTITISPKERVTPEVIRRKLREVHFAADLNRLNKERDRDRERYEGEADKAGHRVVEGEVTGRSVEVAP